MLINFPPVPLCQLADLHLLFQFFRISGASRNLSSSEHDGDWQRIPRRCCACIQSNIHVCIKAHICTYMADLCSHVLGYMFTRYMIPLNLYIEFVTYNAQPMRIHFCPHYLLLGHLSLLEFEFNLVSHRV